MLEINCTLIRTDPLKDFSREFFENSLLPHLVENEDHQTVSSASRKNNLKSSRFSVTFRSHNRHQTKPLFERIFEASNPLPKSLSHTSISFPEISYFCRVKCPLETVRISRDAGVAAVGVSPHASITILPATAKASPPQWTRRVLPLTFPHRSRRLSNAAPLSVGTVP